MKIKEKLKECYHPRRLWASLRSNGLTIIFVEFSTDRERPGRVTNNYLKKFFLKIIKTTRDQSWVQQGTLSLFTQKTITQRKVQGISNAMIAQRHAQIIQTLQINVHKSNNEIYHFLLMSASFPQLMNPDTLTNLPPYSDTLTPFKARTGFFPIWSSNFSAYVKGTVLYNFMRIEASGEGCCLWTHFALIIFGLQSF